MNKYILPLYNRLDIAFIKGKKSIIFDENKKDYIDFASGVGVNSLGYANKKVVKTIEKQAKKVLHTSNIYRIKPQEECAKKIVELSTYDMQCFFCNSGAEANETAIKLARKYGNVTFKNPKYKIITIKNSFHGRTIATLKATAQEDKHKYFAPYPDGFVYANDINEAINMIDDTTVGVMLELIQGEGGIFMQDIFQVQRLERILKEKKLLLIIDEVQTGVYRSGNFLISQYFGIKPDIVTLAKGLASGIPIGVMMTSLKDIFTFGDHGSTFGGNPLCTKTAVEVLNILEEKYKAKKIQNTICIFQKELEKILKKNKKLFSSKTGVGLMLGLKLKEERKLQVLIETCLKNQVLVLKSGKDIVRFLPALNISKKEIKLGFKRFQKSLDELK